MGIPVNGDGPRREREALHEIYLSPSFPIIEEIWRKKLSLRNLNPRC